MSIAYALHLLAAIVWVGGMFFAHMVLRPAAMELEPEPRLGLWLRVFGRFFPWVWGAVVVLPLSGYWMIHDHYGGQAGLPLPVHIMQGVGWTMIVLFIVLFFGPFGQMKVALASGDLATAARHQNRIRLIVTANLHLGLAISALVAAWRW